jgi:hypothetical protein
MEPEEGSDMTQHTQTSSGRWATALRVVRRMGRGLAEALEGPDRAARWGTPPAYPLSGGVPGYPIARDAARWRH